MYSRQDSFLFVLLEIGAEISCILQVLEDNEVVADEKSRALEEETKDIKLALTNNEERLTELERRKDVGTRDLQATKEKADMLEKRGNDLSDTIEKVKELIIDIRTIRSVVLQDMKYLQSILQDTSTL